MRIARTFITIILAVLINAGTNNHFAWSQFPNSSINMGAVVATYGTRLGDAAVMDAQANYIMAQSEAYINYQTGYSMYLQNKLNTTRTYFNHRQMNMYYRDLEEWQKEERRALKRAGLYNREAIEYLYGIRR